jgi:hypothetical protein
MRKQVCCFHTGGVGVINSTYLAPTSGTVADATDLVSLDVGSPHLIEDGGIGRSTDRVSKHTLLSELVEFLVLARYLFLPVGSSIEGSSRKFVWLGRTNISKMAPGGSGAGLC